MATHSITPVLLPGESQGWGSLLGCRPWGRTESDTTGAELLDEGRLEDHPLFCSKRDTDDAPLLSLTALPNVHIKEQGHLGFSD